MTIQDDGDLSLVDGDMGANVEAVAAEIGKTPVATLPIVLGGDHTVVSPTLVAQQRRLSGRLSILYIDAHPDLNDISRQMRWSNGCALRRGLEMGEIDPRKVTWRAGGREGRLAWDRDRNPGWHQGGAHVQRGMAG